jgi:hypothetical protein
MCRFRLLAQNKNINYSFYLTFSPPSEISRTAVDQLALPYTGMACREEAHFGLTGMEWNRGNCFGPDWNGLELRKLVLAPLEWFGLDKVSFGLIVMTWNEGSRFWPDWNGLVWRKSVLA